MDAVEVARLGRRAGPRERGDHLWREETEIVNARGWVMDVTYAASDALERWWTDLTEAFSEFEFVVDAIEPLGDGRA